MRTHASPIRARQGASTRGLLPPQPSRLPLRSQRTQVREIVHGPTLQPKLTVGPPDDAYEREADRVADQVMRMPEPEGNLQRMCSECEEELQRKPVEEMEEEEELRAKRSSGGGVPNVDGGLEARIRSLRGRGRPLSGRDRAFFEPRFGHDFDAVRIHSGPRAAELARSVDARAFTIGPDIVFGSGEHRPETAAGGRLLAHELTHVVQQGGGGASTLSSQASREGEASAPIVQPIETMRPTTKGDHVVRRQAASTSGPSCGVPSGCPAAFCTPFPNRPAALAARAALAPVLLGGIAARVSPRVVPLWTQYLFGGSAPQDLTGRFGGDFTSSLTTSATTDFLVDQLKRNVEGNPPAFAPGATRATINLAPRIGSAIADLGDPTKRHVMDFNVIGEIPGNIAGGVGRTQTSCPVGARPSPFDDDRTAAGTAEVIRNANATFTILPSIQYEVRDTIDLCPGNCGAGIEQVATVPMSRMEASGISGDVPFVVRFPAPPRVVTTRPVAPPPAPTPPVSPPSPAHPAPGSTGHSCREGEGPPAVLSDPEGQGPHPLIYRGVTRRRSRNPSVGDAQELLNRFLARMRTGEFPCVAGADLERIRRIRASLGQDPLDVDCRFGPNTEKATVMFQICRGLRADGKIGQETWPELDRLRSGPP